LAAVLHVSCFFPAGDNGCQSGSLILTAAINTYVTLVVETPKNSRNKYKFDIESKIFKISKVLPEGNSFPYDFGYVPATMRDDGDLKIAIYFLMDEAFKSASFWFCAVCHAHAPT
jgi:inorganic pyrophosphatase